MIDRLLLFLFKIAVVLICGLFYVQQDHIDGIYMLYVSGATRGSELG